MSRVLVTGGAGFIGSHLVDGLLASGREVRVLDAFVEQTHGSSPRELPPEVEVIKGDVRDRDVVEKCLEGIEVVYHLAAEVGVGQSMYEIHRYVDANTRGTAVLLEAIVERRRQIKKLIVASSMSIYGEGAYACPKCGPVAPTSRAAAQFEAQDWELHCPDCNSALAAAPTPETKPLDPTSVYAVGKQDQEQLCLIVGRAYGVPTVALRYFNIYGVGQALSNPYTGAVAIFASRLLNGQPPLIFEDGLQSRDFTNVADVVQANLLALESDVANYKAINVGTGVATPIAQVARMLAEGLGLKIEPTIVGKFREGDIRHCVADIARAKELLGYQPTARLADGIPPLLEWVKRQSANDAVNQATDELKSRGLVR
ncbi:MAG: NAD-dependent epimerase/dehydratase family protein [Blastocatellales bacterium]